MKIKINTVENFGFSFFQYSLVSSETSKIFIMENRSNTKRYKSKLTALSELPITKRSTAEAPGYLKTHLATAEL